MIDYITAINIGNLPVATILVLFALAVITDKLVWHTRLKKVEDQRDRWETIALEALTAGAQAGVKAAEVTVGVVSAMPDPARVVGKE